MTWQAISTKILPSSSYQCQQEDPKNLSIICQVIVNCKALYGWEIFSDLVCKKKKLKKNTVEIRAIFCEQSVRKKKLSACWEIRNLKWSECLGREKKLSGTTRMCEEPQAKQSLRRLSSYLSHYSALELWCSTCWIRTPFITHCTPHNCILDISCKDLTPTSVATLPRFMVQNMQYRILVLNQDLSLQQCQCARQAMMSEQDFCHIALLLSTAQLHFFALGRLSS